MIAAYEKDRDVAEVYAAALFALAQEAGLVERVQQELAELVRLVQEQELFAAFLVSAGIEATARQKSLERMFRGRLCDLLVNTLQVMNQHGRLGALAALLSAYQHRVEQARGQIEVRVTSAVPLDEGQKQAVHRLVERLTGKRPLIEYVVDPDLIGGLVLEIDDLRYDDSIRRRLRTVLGRLFDRSSRGVLSAA
jgi:F-type H+-transporting ATPase subunit delta